MFFLSGAILPAQQESNWPGQPQLSHLGHLHPEWQGERTENGGEVTFKEKFFPVRGMSHDICKLIFFFFYSFHKFLRVVNALHSRRGAAAVATVAIADDRVVFFPHFYSPVKRSGSVRCGAI